MASRLARAYGGRAHDVMAVAREVAGRADPLQGRELAVLVKGYPYLAAEAVFAARYEWAMHAEDVIARRTRLAFLNKEAAIGAIPQVVRLMGDELNWSEEKRRQESHRCVEFMRHFGGPKAVLASRAADGRLAVRVAAPADLRDAFDRVVGARPAMGPVELQLAGELLGHSLSQEEVDDCLQCSQSGETSSLQVSFAQFEAWWNSDRLNPGLISMRVTKSASAETVEGSGTLFG